MILRITIIVIFLFSQAYTFAFVNDIYMDDDIFALVSNNISKTRSKNIIVDRIWDLKGKTYRLPKGSVLISKGGLIKNGILIGDDTQIKTSDPVFSNVRIKGKWNVPYISTKLFVDLSYDNSLRDVIALTNPIVKNIVTIESGNYNLSVRDNDDTALVGLLEQVQQEVVDRHIEKTAQLQEGARLISRDRTLSSFYHNLIDILNEE